MSQSDVSQVPKLILKSTKDALLIIEAAERGLFPRLVRRLTEQERTQSIYSGAVLVYDEFESQIRRFTDTLVWSPSRIIGNYLVYREMKKHEPRPTSRAGAALPPRPASSRSLVRPRTDSSLEQSESEQKKKEQLYVGSLTYNERFKPNGLVKRTFSLATKGKHIHVIGYYTYEDAMEDRFLSPSEHPEFADLSISQDLLEDKSIYRIPPRIERLADGRLVYAGEEEKKSISDSERISPEGDRESPSTSSTSATVDSMDELPPLRQLPLTRAWDPMPTVDPSVYDGPAYTCQARVNDTQYELSEFEGPSHAQDQISLPPLSIPLLTPSPPPSRSVSRIRDGRQNPYPDNQGRPHATNLNIARSLRESEFNPTNPSFPPVNAPEFTPVTPSPEYHEQLTWPVPSNLNRSGYDMSQDYGYSRATNNDSMRSAAEPVLLRAEPHPYGREVGPTGETIEYDPIPAGSLYDPLMDEEYQRWVDLSNEDITPDVIRDTLFPLDDELWVAAACADRILSDVEAQTALLELGLLRTSQASEKIQAALEDLVNSGDDTDPEEQFDEDGDEKERIAERTKPTESDLLKRALNEDETSRKLLGLRLVLLQRLDLTRTYGELLASGALSSRLNDNERLEDDDPWAEERPLSTSSLNAPWLSLSEFLTTDVIQLALLCASTRRFSALKTLFTRHLQDLLPFRLHILESIPAHVPPVEYVDLLPACNFSTAQEETRLSHPWREVPDWVEQPHVRAALIDTGAEDFPQFDASAIERPGNPHPELLPATELTAWFKRRIETIDSLGLVDAALAFVQHAAALAIPGLDAEGEELSLLARLVYDAPVPEDKPLTAADDWNLTRWRSMDPPAVIRAYLAHSTPETVAADIRRLVVPYLFVLDARKQREQTGSPVQTEQNLSDELLYGWILDAPLDLAASVFIESKADLPVATRVIQKDEDLARLALACLYGSDALDAWPTMSSIFECLPAWEISESGENNPDAEEADTTLASLAAFVKPTTAKPKTAPADLYAFFRPLPARALSRALDILDVHLESGEVLSRWGVPAPLRWFVLSAGDAALQRSWAIKMARRSGAEGGEILLDDMIKLSGGALGDLRGAFGALKKDEVIRIFFEGLLSSGRFDMAHDMLNPRGIPPPLSTDAVERLCLAVSREFYDNATSGNIHSGDMKLAYECLNVPLPTQAVIKEREFIEATSRICAFNVVSRPGVPITPLEIRLVKDRLSLDSGGDPAAEVKALAMIADAALSSEDFEVAAEVSTRMVKTAVKLRGSDTAAAHEATEVCWHTCYQLGRQTEFTDAKAKMTLLAHALELCPPENVNDVLTAWKRLETEKLEAFKVREPPTKQPRRKRTGDDLLAITDLSTPLISPDAAAAAARTFSRVAGAAANFPFSVRGRLGYGGAGDRDNESVVSGMSTRSRSPESTVSTTARHALSRGVGWLIGANE
ncbi:hypothetical protein OPQ81_009621 [Rhizoctonia solani]|nr:hypothetical protein OPQ81_009621 [Rhizoctonia solani]